jgi:hypothetical protein
MHSDDHVLSSDGSERVMSHGSAPFLHSNSRSTSKRGDVAPRPKFVKKIKVVMYNFGSPRVGNAVFCLMYDKEVPKSYRVVVDGDVVTGLPPSGYRHVGTEILIDSTGSGSIIIDPSFVERWLRTHTKSSVAAHSLLVYRKGLLGIKLSAEFMKQRAVDYAKQDLDADPLRLALKVRSSIHVESALDYDYHQSHLEEEEAQERLNMSEKRKSDSAPKAMSYVDAVNTEELRMSNNGGIMLYCLWCECVILFLLSQFRSTLRQHVHRAAALADGQRSGRAGDRPPAHSDAESADQNGVQISFFTKHCQ